ncbi:carbonic anhydrase 3-like [Bufo gargarizans]|uniref:carbonic anhydrase 3-like n=1 Tax=Bufo gargarizans TaxID=30331 RepID=UPI001CF3A95A|nr:carbonic anhydrase 3-like [Bufo gargarizans]
MSRIPEWGYGTVNGPDTWADYFPSAKGQNQSPIELHTRYIRHDASLKPWTASYRPSSSLTILNDGTTIRVMFDGSSVLKDGPLNGTYRLLQLQFHWGSSDDQGSEHVIDGLRYAGEIQFVHWNSKYDNITEAKKHPDGVAIIAVFLKIGKAKQHLNAIVEAIGCIKAKGRKAHFTDFDPSILFPTSRDYWTYQGSCTTPPCVEGVTWLLLREPIPVSPEQMKKFRSLLATMECEIPIQLVNNYRPTQPLNGREVRASFD